MSGNKSCLIVNRIKELLGNSCAKYNRNNWKQFCFKATLFPKDVDLSK